MSSSNSFALPRAGSELSDHVFARSKDYVLYRGDSLELMDQFED